MSDFWSYANQLEPRRDLRCFLYGATRSGKTEIAASFPRPLFIFPKNENSEETIRGRPYPFKRICAMGRDRVTPQDRAAGFVSMEEVLDVLWAAQQQGQIQQFCGTVVVESLTHYCEIVEQELAGGGKMNWAAYSMHFKHLKNVLWQLDCHVVLTALSKVKTNKNNEIVSAGANIFGKAAENLPSSCDLVVYCEQLPGPQWQAHVQKFGVFDGGTRIQGMPPGSYQNFSFGAHIAPYLGNGNGAATDQQQQLVR